MDQQLSARALVSRLSEVEREALINLVRGGSVRDLARLLSIDASEAGDILDAMKRRLGVTQNAEAVRIGLIAGNLE